ncbi:hypothetical protein BLOT_014994 [Blomia tropicalis]|nr:hypothetical protein BLOT_014994 [Blomia tropicalis]
MLTMDLQKDMRASIKDWKIVGKDIRDRIDQHYGNSKQIFIESIPFGPMKQTKKFLLKLYLRREKSNPDLIKVSVAIQLKNSNKDEIMNCKFEVSILIGNATNTKDIFGTCNKSTKLEKMLAVKDILVLNYSNLVSINLIVNAQMTYLNEVFNSNFKEKLVQDIRNIRDLETFSDLILESEDKHRIHVHKVVLAARSSVFFNELKEVSNQKFIMSIPYKREVVDAMLNYIYKGDISNIDNFANDLVKAANKYGLDELKEQCTQSLLKQININSAAELYHIADRCNLVQLKSKIIPFIEQNKKQVTESVGWRKFIEPNLKLFREIFVGYVDQSTNKRPTFIKTDESFTNNNQFKRVRPNDDKHIQGNLPSSGIESYNQRKCPETPSLQDYFFTFVKNAKNNSNYS